MEPNRSHQSVTTPFDAGDPSPAFVVNATDLSIVHTNGAAAQAFGYDPGHLMGAPIAALVLVPDELQIRDHIQDVADRDRAPESVLAATIVHADGSLAHGRLAVTVDAESTALAPVATVVVHVGGVQTSSNGDGAAEPSTSAWIVHEINHGSLRDSEIGMALFHARTCRLVAANPAYTDLADGEHLELAHTLTERMASTIDAVDARAIHAVRSGELGMYTGPRDAAEATRTGRYLVCGIGPSGVVPTYFTACLYPPDHAPAPVLGLPVVDAVGQPATHNALGHLGAIVDDRWHIRILPRYSRVFGDARELGESLLPLVHPADLPALIELGESVRSGQLALGSISLRTHATEGTWTPIDVEITRVSGTDPEPWLAILYSPTPAYREVTPGIAGTEGEEWEPLLLLTHPELSNREREVARALLSGYRVTTIARRLFLSPSTVRNHLSSMFHKVGVESQAELIERFRLLRYEPTP
jgi:DNA-binding CsgD family transcriptional regulator